eukprot:Nk52_evm84s2192 gene=Nk52_evmTU84s2192
MFSVMKELNDDQRKVLKVFPLRTSAIPKHFTLCSKGVLETFVEAKEKKSFKPNKDNQDRIWSQIFNLEHKALADFRRKGYKFNDMIDTDGEVEDLYITDKRIDLERLNTTIIVGIDPGKSDLLYCTDSHTKGGKQMRYSQDQRRKMKGQEKASFLMAFKV